MKSIDDIEVNGLRVLVRSDLNVPLDKSGSGAITDDGRIRASLPVIKKLADRGARVIVMAHLGRPVATRRRRPAGRAPRPAGRLRDRPGRPVGDRHGRGPGRRRRRAA
jgi:phosphoglycerate kinase